MKMKGKIESKGSTLPETNIAHENPIFPGKYHQNGGFSMAMLVSGSVTFRCKQKKTDSHNVNLDQLS